VGSAQARRGGAILQHGSILLDIDWDAWVSVFAYASDAGKQRAYAKLPTRMTSLRHELGHVVPFEKVIWALSQSFPKALGIDLTPVRLSTEEEAAAHKLAREKYSTQAWTLKT
jgi:lipoate-protein ligase A